MERLFWHIVAGILSIFLAVKFVPGVNLAIIPGESVYFDIALDQEWKILLLVGTFLGIINLIIKPILDKITIPLKILTLGFFSLILNMGIIWGLEVLIKEFDILGIIPLFFTTLIVWVVNFFLGLKK